MGERNNMAEDFKYQSSFKTKSGNMINLRAMEVEEHQAQLQDLANMLPQIEEIEKTIGAMETVYQVMGPDRGPAGSGGGGGNYRKPSGPSAPAATPPADANEHTCTHGVMNYREAKPGSGKNWKGYFCPTPQGTQGQCSPQFIR